MADVQRTGAAPAGGAVVAGLAGSSAAPVVAVASPAGSTGGLALPLATGTVSGVTAGADTGAVAGKADPAAATNAPQKAAKRDDLEVRDAVKKANQALAAINTQLVFVFDDQTHHMTVKLLDIQTQKVVQEIPTAAMPATASALSGSSASGALVDTKA